MHYTSQRYGGYEVSSHGDKRFSAFFARMPDGRSIEEHYQCDCKGYSPGGKNWRLGKGKPPLDKSKDMWKEYMALWSVWADSNEHLLVELGKLAIPFNGVLSDKFASGPVNQARALAVLLNTRL